MMTEEDASSLMLDNMNKLRRKLEVTARAMKAEGKSCHLEDVLPKLREELIQMDHDEMIRMSAFCVGLCLAIGPTKLKTVAGIQM